MSSFSPNQQKFIATYSKLTGLHPGVVSAQLAAEEPVGAQAGWHGTQDWLNIGITDRGPQGAGNPAWRDPVSAAKLSAAWATGQTPIPGFGHAASSIVNAVRGTAGQGPQAQISALQKSGWASSGYPNLGRLFSMYAGNSPSAGSVGSMPSASLEVPKQVTSFDAAGFEQARKRFIIGDFLKQQGSDASGGASNALFSSGLLTTTAPNKADYTHAQTVLQKVAGETPLNTHPSAASAKAGVGTFTGKPVADWIVPILQYAKAHGWQGVVNSGYRSFAQQKAIYDSGVRPAAVPGTSNHEGDQFPRGAVDVSNAQQLSSILSKSPYAKALVWAGGKDPVHFSHPHGGSY